jgi:hypothetical protein
VCVCVGPAAVAVVLCAGVSEGKKKVYIALKQISGPIDILLCCWC